MKKDLTKDEAIETAKKAYTILLDGIISRERQSMETRVDELTEKLQKQILELFVEISESDLISIRKK